MVMSHDLHHVTQTMNSYKAWILYTMQPSSNKQNVNMVCPTLSKLSEQLARIFKSYDISVYHKIITTLSSLLVYLKDKTDKAAKCRVVYDITCSVYNQHYIGDTVSPLAHE